jgi:hypothetical protein
MQALAASFEELRARTGNPPLVFLHKSFVFFGTEFILISLISLSVTSTKRPAAILKTSVLLYSPEGEYNSLIRQIRPINL